MKKIRSLFHVIVKNIGPTQCANCQSIGHGQENCFKLPKCMRYGGNHKSFECPFLVKQAYGKQKIPEDKVKCINCGQKHTSCSVDCIIRTDNQRFNKNIQTTNSGFTDAPELHNFNFSSINPHHRVTKQQAWNNHNVPPKTNTNNDLFTQS